jgi:hypothetical protein
MNPELERRLHAASKEQLIRLLQELVMRHPVLLTEMSNIMQTFSDEGNSIAEDASIDSIDDTDDTEETEETEGEVTEDWDFGGDEPIALHSFSHHTQPTLLPLNKDAPHQRIEEYATRLSQEDSAQVLMNILAELIDEAITCIAQKDDTTALDLFAVMFEERLRERNPALTSTFDDMIDAAMFSLEPLLTEASGNPLFDTRVQALSPLLTPHIRHRWLERLFALWIKRLDAHRLEEDLPEIMFDVAWGEDLRLLRTLAQNELQKQPESEHANIVDFTRQYRTKALEKFLKELPRA